MYCKVIIVIDIAITVRPVPWIGSISLQECGITVSKVQCASKILPMVRGNYKKKSFLLFSHSSESTQICQLFTYISLCSWVMWSAYVQSYKPLNRAHADTRTLLPKSTIWGLAEWGVWYAKMGEENLVHPILSMPLAIPFVRTIDAEHLH